MTVTKPFVAAMLAALVLLLDAMAVCEPLHEWLHHDAHQTSHQCAATLFSHGQVDSTAVSVAASVPLTSIDVTPAVEFSVFHPFIENLPAERAPPVSSSNS